MSGFDMATWAWPQWCYAIVFVLNLSFGAVLHGQPKTGQHSFPVSLVGAGIGFGLLLAGGFWA